VSSLVQADAFGIPVANVLREQSKEARIKRRQRAEEKAQKVPVKIMVPLVLFILPVLFIVVIGPGAISLINNFKGV
jgi:tight adherence protein C